MKNKLNPLLSLVLILSVGPAQAQGINGILEKNNIEPQMISYHPNGDWFISCKADNGSKFHLVKIQDVQTASPKIDTLDFGYYQNISKLSNDGDEFLYGFLDTLQQKQERRTYLRQYKNGEFSEPIDFRRKTGLNALTYFMLEDNGDVYFYTYDLKPKGIYLVKKLQKGYSQTKLLIANKPNFVPFSPLLIDSKTMILAQHGQDDKSVNGIYVSKMRNEKWSSPKKLEGLPYGWSLGFGPNNSILYLVAETRRVKYLNPEVLNDKIALVLE